MVAADILADNEEVISESERLMHAQIRARVGSVIRGKWRVDAVLGVGGMAAVYAATHRNGHRCAIKMLLPSFSSNTEVIHRFLKEGYVANEVGHPGAVSVLDDDVTDDGAHFLVMEFLEGESFDRVLSRHPEGLDPFEVGRVALDVLDVLEAAHSHAIVHRDIKPENVFLLKDGRVKLLDFGIARLLQAGSTSTRTQNGAVMGTPSFMPPEQARGLWDDVDAQSDVWAVGAMMYVGLSGRRLREARTTNEELLQAMTVPPPPLHSAAPAIPLAVADVVDRSLLFEKRGRWSSAREMQSALRAALGDHAPTVHQPSFAPPAEANATQASAPRDETGAPRGTELGLTAPRSLASIPSTVGATSARSRLVLGVVVPAVLVFAFVAARVGALSTVEGGAPTHGSVETAASSPPPSQVPLVATPSAAVTDPADAVDGGVAPAASIVAPTPSVPRTSPSWSPVPLATAKQGSRSLPVSHPAEAPATRPPASASLAPPPAPSFDPLNRRR